MARVTASSWRLRHFNSQPHEEADPALLLSNPTADISTRSLTRRLTIGSDGEPVISGVFQLAASRGG